MLPKLYRVTFMCIEQTWERNSKYKTTIGPLFIVRLPFDFFYFCTDKYVCQKKKNLNKCTYTTNKA